MADPDAGGCQSCVNQQCCSELAACTSEAPGEAGAPPCAVIYSCYEQCVTADAGASDASFTTIALQCKMACEGMEPDASVSDFEALFGCAAMNCLSACNQ